MSSIPLTLGKVNDLIVLYKNWVRNNPNTASHYENLFKWTTYFLGGRINNSLQFNELTYAASNLLIFLNDRIIQSSVEDAVPANKLKIWLTVIGYLEAVIEVSSNHLWGDKVKWIITVFIQLLKCSLKLSLLFKYNTRIITSPALQPVPRDPELNGAKESAVGSVAFVLKRSGRVIRKVEASSSSSRLWKPPVVAEEELDDSDDESQRRSLLAQLTGEVLYIAKPLTQLATTYRFGETSWKPFIISLGMDILSLALLESKKRFVSKEEKLEISRRYTSLLLYLLRSPFYERHSSGRFEALANAAMQSIPMSKYILRPLKESIPFYQSMYSYAWST